jgi:hypothetical protein
VTDPKAKTGRVFLGAFPVPKDLDNMTEEELDAFADSVVESMRDSIRKNDGKEPEAKPDEAQ